MCVYVFVCVYDCLGSQRLSEPEFDEGTAVVSKGGWGLFLSVTFIVSHKLDSYSWCCLGVGWGVGGAWQEWLYMLVNGKISTIIELLMMT